MSSSVMSSLLLLFSLLIPCMSKGLTAVPTTNVSPHTTSTRENVGMCSDGHCDDYDGDDGEDDFWWFWLFFVLIVLFVSVCCGICCRMRLQGRRQVLILPGERPHTCTAYGTTEVIAPIIVAPHPSYNNHNPYGYQQTKLPSYTPIAENKGQPPPYR